jgi:hypothetical protein
MKIILLIFSLTCFFASYGQTIIKVKSTSVDSTKIAILSSELIQKYIFQKECKEAKLTDNDAIIVDSLLKKCIDKYNVEAEKEFKQIVGENSNYKPNKEDFVIDIEKYKRQYFVITNSKGEKEVWVNCFCNSWKKDWRKELIRVKDGGNCYFQVKVNLTKKKCYELIVNGSA